jgi:inosose dehydratase
MNRRKFVQKAGVGAASWIALSRLGSAQPPALPNPIGYSVISWPQSQFETAFQVVSELGYKGVQILRWVQDAFPDGKAKELRDQLQKLKLYPAALSCGGVSLRPDSSEPFTDRLTEDAHFLRSLDGGVLQVTDGGKYNGTYSADQIKAMGARMNALGKIAKDAGLTLGYHPHYHQLGETRQGLGRVLDATDPRYVGLIADIAHMTLGGSDPAEIIRTYHQRLVLIHIKDVRRDAYDLAHNNRAGANTMKYYFCEIGRGVVNFPVVVSAVQEVGYRGWMVVELDGYEVPPGGPAESARINKDALKKMGFQIG